MMKIMLGDWLYNAGIIGFLRIQKEAGFNVLIKNDSYIEISKSDLKNFSHRYFVYALMQYMQNNLSVNKILYNGILYNMLSQKFEKNEKKVSPEKIIYTINSKIKDEAGKTHLKYKLDYGNFDLSIKKTIEQMSYFRVKSIEIINNELSEIGIEDKYIKKITDKIEEEFSNKTKKDKKGKEKPVGAIAKIEDESTAFLVTFFRNFYFNKSIIGQYGSERRSKFVDTYVTPAISQIDSDDIPCDGITCKFCRQNKIDIKNTKQLTHSLFSDLMFHTTAVSNIKFKNFFYNMRSDLFMCDVCELLLLCSYAGLNKIPYNAQNKTGDKSMDSNHIFINTPSLQLTYDENEKLKNDYKIHGENFTNVDFKDIIEDIFIHQQTIKSDWSIQNILFVELNTTQGKKDRKHNYNYFHINKNIAKLFQDPIAKKSFNFIPKSFNFSADKKRNMRYFVISKILKHEPLIPICDEIMHNYLQKNQHGLLNMCFNIVLISSISLLYYVYMYKERKESGLKSGTIFAILNGVKDEASTFHHLEYNKRKSKSYVLLSMIRNNSVYEFYDVIVKMYMAENKPVPEFIMQMLNPENNIGFQQYAYAFMSGFLQNAMKTSED